jgi:hypothetical protein
MTAPAAWQEWRERLLTRHTPPPPPPHIPVCACGVAMYAPDSQALGVCFVCRKRATEAKP